MSEFKELMKDGARDAGRQAGKWAKRLFLALLVIGILSSIGYYGWGNLTYSTGSRSGQLIKLSRKGYVLKTYEGQLFLGVYAPEQPSFAPGNIWNFSVKDAKAYEDLSQYEGKQVRLHYREHFRTFPWQGDTRYFVYEAEPIE